MDIDPLTLLSAANVSSSKVDKFNKTIPLKKSQHIRAKEALDKKAKEEEDLAAQAYIDFVQAFDAPDDNPTSSNSNSSNNINRGGNSGRSAPKSFVRAGGGEGYNPLKDKELARKDEIPTGPRGNNASSSSRNAASGSSSSSYNGGASSSGIPTGPRSTYSRPNASSIMQQDEVSSFLRTSSNLISETLSSQPEPPKSSGPPGKKKRDMDNFLEELKRSIIFPLLLNAFPFTRDGFLSLSLAH